MKALLSLLVFPALLAGLAHAQSSTWKLGTEGELLWNNEVYAPVGMRIPGTVTAVQEAKEAGIRDVLVEMPTRPAEWPAVIKALDDAQIRYMITISSLAPSCAGIAVEPETYRIPFFKGERFVEFPLPTADWAMTAMVYQRDGSVANRQKVAIKSGYFSAKLSALGESEQICLIYPHVKELQFPDFWEGLDQHRDALLACLTSAKSSAYFRGIVNPLGEMPKFPSPTTKFVPTSRSFQLELESFLKKKYNTLATFVKAWSISASDFKSFSEASQLVPLYGESRGLNLVWDPVRDVTYTTDQRRSNAWKDIHEVIGATVSRRYRRLIQSIQQVTNVPVTQDFKGWTGPYLGTESLSGLGVRVREGSPLEIADQIGRAGVVAYRRNQPRWMVATHCTAAANPQDLIDSSASLGARGWFFGGANAKEMALAGTSARARKLVYLPFPESAANPASALNLGAVWWLPGPGSGNRIDLGTMYEGYRYSDIEGTFTAIWAPQQARRVKLLVPKGTELTFESYGSTAPNPKIVKGGIEVTIGTTPLVIRGSEEVPVPEDAYREALAQWEGVKISVGEGISTLSDDAGQMTDAIAGFERNPGGSFAQMRQALSSFNSMIANYAWIEAESSRDHSFSETERMFGCSNGGNLKLNTKLPNDLYPIYAKYLVSPRSTEEHTVWMSAKIAPEDRASLVVTIGDEKFRIQGNPVSLYSNGFGWYQLGALGLTRGEKIELKVSVSGLKPVDLAVDCFHLATTPFTPDNVRQTNVLILGKIK